MALQQLHTEIQNELVTMNQLSQLIMTELKQIKTITSPGGELEENVKQNASLMKDLAMLNNTNLTNIPVFDRNPQHN